jgi:hypothetical protein
MSLACLSHPHAPRYRCANLLGCMHGPTPHCTPGAPALPSYTHAPMLPIHQPVLLMTPPPPACSCTAGVPTLFSRTHALAMHADYHTNVVPQPQACPIWFDTGNPPLRDLRCLQPNPPFFAAIVCASHPCAPVLPTKPSLAIGMPQPTASYLPCFCSGMPQHRSLSILWWWHLTLLLIFGNSSFA